MATTVPMTGATHTGYNGQSYATVSEQDIYKLYQQGYTREQIDQMLIGSGVDTIATQTNNSSSGGGQSYEQYLHGGVGNSYYSSGGLNGLEGPTQGVLSADAQKTMHAIDMVNTWESMTPEERAESNFDIYSSPEDIFNAVGGPDYYSSLSGSSSSSGGSASSPASSSSSAPTGGSSSSGSSSSGSSASGSPSAGMTPPQMNYEQIYSNPPGVSSGSSSAPTVPVPTYSTTWDEPASSASASSGGGEESASTAEASSFSSYEPMSMNRFSESGDQNSMKAQAPGLDYEWRWGQRGRNRGNDREESKHESYSDRWRKYTASGQPLAGSIFGGQPQ